MTARTLVERARDGDEDAYQRLAEAIADRLFGVAYRVVRDVDRAQDAVQQTLIAVWTELPTLRDLDRFDAWTYRMLVRFALAEERRNRRKGIAIVPLAELDIPVAEADTVVLRDQLERAFRTLSADQRAVIVLRHHVGLPLTEIARIVDAPYGTVASRLHRATEDLRRALDPDAQPRLGGAPA